MSKEKKAVSVIVLGDFGRSPRMQYHSLSLLRRNFAVDIVAYQDKILMFAYSLRTSNPNEEKTRFTQKVDGKIEMLNKRPALIVSSTSWTDSVTDKTRKMEEEFGNIVDLVRVSKLILRFLRRSPQDTFSETQITTGIVQMRTFVAGDENNIPSALIFLRRNNLICILGQNYQVQFVTANSMRLMRNLYASFYSTHNGYFLEPQAPAPARRNTRARRHIYSQPTARPSAVLGYNFNPDPLD